MKTSTEFRDLMVQSREEADSLHYVAEEAVHSGEGFSAAQLRHAAQALDRQAEAYSKAHRLAASVEGLRRYIEHGELKKGRRVSPPSGETRERFLLMAEAMDGAVEEAVYYWEQGRGAERNTAAAAAAAATQI